MRRAVAKFGKIAMSNRLADLLEEKDVLLADGGMGTSMFAVGLANGAPGELWNTEQPDKIKAIHQSFVDAGSDIILAACIAASCTATNPMSCQST